MIDSNHVELWGWEVEKNSGTISLHLSITQNSKVVTKIVDRFPDATKPLPYDLITYLGVETLHYMLGQADREDSYCHAQDVFAGVREMIKCLNEEPSGFGEEFDKVAREILQANSFSARFTCPAIKKRVGRVEAYFLLKEMRIEQSSDIIMESSYPKTKVETLYYSPHGL